ncbi:MAG: adenylate cyclase [Bacteroidetes bacterium RIFOXYA12_FULL_35_11]|nr:MAG: adenylate cyclase [Bacteroidetes bacterium GWF2_35_48]OFY82985.1 MAG: adenylate cyclase [Bacteroidetes bacterium RIFOXYA12_FULL_35_11]OFY96132.1 MAG: adenylate cyclase [Bacteroidetes bacterium RIFOXYB2_FULL_35_7]OFZ00746.1 MAG: adenylate cyclase [Bacteroidetes bacterium RIFOXYC12_FULL_35_7]HBX49498.1 adenylate cyclase [Bacteroidales bacterium]
MNIEIEKKFTVTNESWKEEQQGVLYMQGYICRNAGKSVRVRIAGNTSYLTIKGGRTGLSRDEFEYSIPVDDAKSLLEKYCEGKIIEKFRYKIMFEGKLWEVDEFLGNNKGLVMAEIELLSETEEFVKPDWIGKDVTNDPKYYNANMIDFPYSEW